MSGRKIRYIDTGRKTRRRETPFSTGKKVTKKHFDKDDVRKKTEHPRGRRRLDFSDKLPFNGRTFYLDLYGCNTHLLNQLEKDLQDLGGVVEKFFSNDVNCVIVHRSNFNEQDSNSWKNTQSSTGSTSTQSIPPTTSLRMDRSNVNHPSSTTYNTRGKALVQQAAANIPLRHLNSGNAVISKAKALGIKIVTLDKVQSYLKKEKTTANLGAIRKDRNRDASKKLDIKAQRLKTPFVKVTDSSGDFKPLVAEFNTWPRVNLNSSSGSCPFKSSKKKELHKPKIQKPVKCSSPDRLAEVINSPPKKIVHNAPTIKGRLNLTITNFGYKDSRHQRRKVRLCECCGKKFDDFDEHVNSWKHREFARNDSNYRTIDELIDNELRIEDLIDNIRNDAKETNIDDTESVTIRNESIFSDQGKYSQPIPVISVSDEANVIHLENVNQDKERDKTDITTDSHELDINKNYQFLSQNREASELSRLREIFLDSSDCSEFIGFCSSEIDPNSITLTTNSSSTLSLNDEVLLSESSYTVSSSETMNKKEDNEGQHSPNIASKATQHIEKVAECIERNSESLSLTKENVHNESITCNQINHATEIPLVRSSSSGSSTLTLVSTDINEKEIIPGEQDNLEIKENRNVSYNKLLPITQHSSRLLERTTSSLETRNARNSFLSVTQSSQTLKNDKKRINNNRKSEGKSKKRKVCKINELPKSDKKKSVVQPFGVMEFSNNNTSSSDFEMPEPNIKHDCYDNLERKCIKTTSAGKIIRKITKFRPGCIP